MIRYTPHFRSCGSPVSSFTENMLQCTISDIQIAIEAISTTATSHQRRCPCKHKHRPCQEGVLSHETQCAQVTKVRQTHPEPKKIKKDALHATAQKPNTEHVRGCAIVGNSFLRNKLGHFNNFLLNLWNLFFNDSLHCATLHLVNNVTSPRQSPFVTKRESHSTTG